MGVGDLAAANMAQPAPVAKPVQPAQPKDLGLNAQNFTWTELAKRVLAAPGAARPGDMSYGLAKGGVVPEPQATATPQMAPADLPGIERQDPNEVERLAARFGQQPEGGAGAAGGVSVGSLGGYKARTLSLPEEIERASTQASGAIQAELEAGRRYAQQVTPLQAQESQRVQQRMAAEEGRMGRLVDLGKQQQTLTDEMGKRVESFRVDPNRIFGQGGERAATTFGIGIASALSNIGEAMQGKAATNQILSLVQNRIAQDIGLQENDYRRMLQGYEVKRNGLMDAIRQVGDERLGAEALAKQQGLFYADQLGKIAKQVGLTDAQAARPLLEAQARILQGLGEQKGRVEQFNVAAQNQQAQFNAQLEAQRRQLEAQLRASSVSYGALDKEDKARVREQLTLAEKQGLYTRGEQTRDMLNQLKANPNVAKEASGVIANVVRSIANEKDISTIDNIVRNIALEQLSPEGQTFVRSWQSFVGARLRALGGTAITANERALFDMRNYASPQQMQALIGEESRKVRTEAESLLKSSGTSGAARDWLAYQLKDLYGDVVTPPPPPPAAPGTK